MKSKIALERQYIEEKENKPTQNSSKKPSKKRTLKSNLQNAMEKQKTSKKEVIGQNIKINDKLEYSKIQNDNGVIEYIDIDLYNYSKNPKTKKDNFTNNIILILSFGFGFVLIYNFYKHPKKGWRPLILYLIIMIILFKVYDTRKKYLLFDKL